MREVNVAIADDNERILDMLGEIIEQDQDLNLIGKADNGEDIYHLIKEKKPDVVLLDLIMPKMDGLSVMEKVNMDEQITKRTGIYYRDSCRTGKNYRRCLPKRSKLLCDETISQ